ncbi:MAG: type II secretion system protein [Planctomycetota bacterium]
MTGSLPLMGSVHRRGRGFSLVEILVVITIMALLVTIVASSASNILDEARVTNCKKNLTEIANNMMLLKKSRRERGKKAWPKARGIRFLLELTRHSELQGGKHSLVSGKKTKIFICPGTDDISTTYEDSTPGSAYFDLDNLDSMTISYAGRNQIDFPLEKDPAGDDAILAADDNEGRANHKFKTNYVTADSVVDNVDISDFLDEFPELEYLPVGPDSPYEPFQKLSVDI